jgi:predicted branched-subunit amino acid permease
VLIAGALGSLAVAAVWIVSRTAGVPIGPTPGEPEAVGLIDTVASCDEVLLAALVGLHLREEQSRRALTATALVLLLLSSLLVLGPHVH